MWKRGKAWHQGIGGESDALTFWHTAEPGAACNECRAVLVGDSRVMLAALMRELNRWP